MTENEILIIKETIAQLKGIMDVTPRQRAKDLVKSAIGRSVRTKDPMFWPAGMLMLGLSEARRTIIEKYGNQEDAQKLVAEIDSSIMKHLGIWTHRHGGKIGYIDDALAGAALIKLYQQCYDEAIRVSCKDAADKIYHYLENAPRDKEGTIVYNADRDACNVFADGVGQVSMFLSLYGKVFEEKEALELAKVQLLNFKKNGMDEKSGLPYHGYANGEKKGVLSWGRAAGWLIMGLSEYVACVDDGAVNLQNGDAKLISWYEELSRCLLTYQRPEGGYAWQVQATEGHLDTSATGMIVYGLLEAGKLAPEKVMGALEALLHNTENGKVGNALSSCDDFGVHYQTYAGFPWGQGAALAALAKNVVM